MKKKIVIAIVILALIAAAAAAVLMMNRPAEIAVTTVETIDTPAQTESADAVDAEAMVVDAEVEEVAELVELYGKVTEITDEYVMLFTEGLGDVKVMMTEDTIIEGVEALEIGQTVKVLYTGMMTRSLPPQITALLIGVYAVSGEVTAVEGERVTIAGETGEVILTLQEGMTAPAVGAAITAYTTGISTMSIPPQMNAVEIETVESVG